MESLRNWATENGENIGCFSRKKKCVNRFDGSISRQVGGSKWGPPRRMDYGEED